ncbi:MAG: Uma2 family endonuclease [Gemmatimonadales bacterium]|nr:Uma2 family endonuclease [Gemmatimonadales bacterium]
MAMPVLPEVRRYTVAEALALPDDGNRYEVVHGELLVTPAPRAVHQGVVTRLLVRLAEYLKPLGLERTLFSGPADIFWGDDVWVQPDILVVVPEEVSTDWRTYKTLRLVIEVLSPSSTRGDRVVKRGVYQENRVATYWVVDADRRVVEVWHPKDEAPESVTDVLRWRVTPDAPELEIVLNDVWAQLPKEPRR